MKRFRTLAPAVAVAAVALAALAGAASANGGRHGEGSVAPPGVLEAGGDGIAAAVGKLTLRICATDAILLAKGNVTIAPDAFTDEVGWLGLHVYFGLHGCADVAPGMSMLNGGGGGMGGGGRTAALAAGTGLTLRAEGTGIAFLRGTGTWSNSNGESGLWTEQGSILKVGGKPAATPCAVQAQHYGGKKPKCGTPAATSTATAAPEPTATPTTEPTVAP